MIHAAIYRFYENLLERSLANSALSITVVICMLAISFSLLPLIGTELMPASDEGQVRVDIDMAGGTRLEVLDETMLGIEAAVKRSVA